MPKKIFLNIFLLIFIMSCASSFDDRRLGTGKPKFASLEIEEVSYHLNSENGFYKPGQPLKLTLKLKNVSQTTKKFETVKNKLLILVINNEYSENLKTLDIPADKYLDGSSFELDPDEEKTFEISVDTSEEMFKNYESIFCQFRLYFLPRQFRRNSLSVYIEKK